MKQVRFFTSLGPDRQRGSGLIEVLVAVVVMSLGLYAAANLHSTIIRSGTTALNRSMATSIVQDVMDRLRGFDAIDVNCSSASFSLELSTFPDFDCYSEIPSDASESLQGSVVRNGQAFDVFISGIVASDNASWKSYKSVEVRVEWTDLSGDAEVSASSAIYPYPLGSSVLGEGESFSCVGAFCDGPKVSYSPMGVPDVVPIELGDGFKRETSKALPDVSSKGTSVSTSFASVNFSSANKLGAKDEYVTVECTCEFDAIAQGYPASFLTYDSDGRLKVKYPLNPINKMTGRVATIPGENQDEFCSACCRDHHDSEGPSVSEPSTALYDPDRHAADYVSDNHLHYYFSNAVDASGNTTNATPDPTSGLRSVSQVAGNRYLEACRFLRVDGLFRLMQDWRLADILVMPKDDYLTNAANLLAYQAWVTNVVKERTRADLAADAYVSPSAPSNRDLTVSAFTPVQLLARGVYVDRVYRSNSPRELISSNQYTATNFLSKIPFDEVNLTLLTSWKSNAPTVVSVTNDTIKDISSTDPNYYGSYSRGRALMTNSSDGSSAEVTAYALSSSSGLTGGVTRELNSGLPDYLPPNYSSGSSSITYSSELGIDRHDHSSANRRSGSLTITRSGGSTSILSGAINQGNSDASLISVSVNKIVLVGGVETVGEACSVNPPTGTSTTFVCSFGPDETKKAILTSSQSGAVFDDDVTGVSASSSIVCQEYASGSGACAPSYLFGPLVNLYGTCNGNRCGNLVATSGSYVCSVVKQSTGNTYDVFCPVLVDTSDYSWSTAIAISGANKLDVELWTGSVNCPGSTSRNIDLNQWIAKYGSFNLQDGTTSRQAFNICATN